MNSKKPVLSLVIICLLLLCFCACDVPNESCIQHVDTNNDNCCDNCGTKIQAESNPPIDNPPVPNQSRVSFTVLPEGVQLYTGAAVSVENTSLPLHLVKVNNTYRWSANPTNKRSDSGVGYFFLEGKAKITVTVEDMTSCVVRPLSAGIQATVQDNKATFTISSAGNYSIEPNGEAQNAFFLFVSPMEKQAVENTATTVIRFEKGLHTSNNNDVICNDVVQLYSNTVVILEDGAVVRARFVANNAQNITICGTGVIDGSTFVRNASTGQVTVPLDFNYCKNIVFKDFSVLDPAGWCVNWYFCQDSAIDGIKIISSRPNGDGISLQSCKNIDVSNCFLRTWDDSLVVKNYPRWDNRTVEGQTNNITFTNCAIWTDLAQCMEVGYETIGEVMEDITFQDITVLHAFHKPVMSIHNANNANIKRVTFQNITIEDASMGNGDAGRNNQLCEFSAEFSSTWSTNHKTTALGSVDGVTVKNVTVLSGNDNIFLRIVGSVDSRSGYNNTIHRVDNVTFENIWIKDQCLTSDYPYITQNSYASFTITDGAIKHIVPFVFTWTEEQLQTYTGNSVVQTN